MAEARSTSIEDMPGKIFLSKNEGVFLQAKALVLPLKSELNPLDQAGEEKQTGKPETQEWQNNLKSFPKQISFKDFVKIINNISKFSKSKDMNSYSQWLSTLEPKFKASVNINKLLVKEQKGEAINWGVQLKAIGDQLYLSEQVIQKIKSELSKYRPVLIELHKALKDLPAESRGLYSNFVSLLDEEEETSAKKSELKMILLQVSDSGLKEKLLKEISELIDKLT